MLKFKIFVGALLFTNAFAGVMYWRSKQQTQDWQNASENMSAVIEQELAGTKKNFQEKSLPDATVVKVSREGDILILKTGKNSEATFAGDTLSLDSRVVVPINSYAKISCEYNPTPVSAPKSGVVA
jgi:hypothetical protein